jgi:steroid delta-isomerase-like uncharacterized protein
MADTRQRQRETAEEISDAFVRAYNTGDTSLIEPVVTDDFVAHNLSEELDLHGASEYAGRIKEIRGAFDGFEMEEEFLVVEGDRGASRIRWRGRHTDTFQGIPATNREVDTTSVALLRMDDGGLAEMWVYNDTTGLMRQLGVDPTGNR